MELVSTKVMPKRATFGLDVMPASLRDPPLAENDNHWE